MRAVLALASFALAATACRDREPTRSVAAAPVQEAAATAPDAASPYEDWYPDDITPPAGTEYPCALTALPRDLPGVPPSDRRFINHCYSMLLHATQAKLVLLKALESTHDLEHPLDRYLAQVQEAHRRIADEPVPAGLEPFAQDVLAALELQQSFFVSAVERRAQGVSMREIYQHPDGRRASRHLLTAWSRMQRRYPSWTREMQDSVYHHLCALDLF